MAELHGIRVGLLETRMTSELAGLVRRHGGEPVSAPAVSEEPLDCSEQVAALVTKLSEGAFPYFVFQTGVGANALFQTADRQGRLPELLTALHSMTTVCRGPKPAAALRRQGVQVSITVASPYTTTELLEALQPLDLAGKRVAVTHYGERNVPLAEAIQERGAILEELCLYQWRLPEDVAPLRSLIQELAAGSLDAIAFTSQVQIRHLFSMAAEMGLAGAIAESMRSRTISAAVGPSCAATLQSYGVTPQVAPANPKMGPMVLALAEAVELRIGASIAGGPTASG